MALPTAGKGLEFHHRCHVARRSRVTKGATHGDHQPTVDHASRAPKVAHARAQGNGLWTPALLQEWFELRPGCQICKDHDQKTRRVVGNVTQPTPSTTPTTVFRYDPTNKWWVFNQDTGTKDLAAGDTYVYYIPLIDGTNIFYVFGLK